MCDAKRHVRFTPESDRKSGHQQPNCFTGLGQALRPNTRNYCGPRGENFVCSTTPSATAAFDCLRSTTLERDLSDVAECPKADMRSALADVR